jgi:hypothetical protein
MIHCHPIGMAFRAKEPAFSSKLAFLVNNSFTIFWS